MKVLRPSKKWVLAAIGLLLALLILKIVFFLTAKPKITVDYVAEYNKMARPQDYDSNENAAENYQKAYDAFVETPSQLRWPLRNWPTDFNASDQSTLNLWLASNEQAFEYFREASRKPYYWLARRSERDNTVAGIMLPELNPFRQLTRALLWDAKIKAIQGQFQPVFANILVCYNAGQHKCCSSLLLVEQHNGLGIKKEAVHSALIILNSTNIEEKALGFLQDALQSELSKDDCIPSIHAEKYFLYDALQRTFIDNGKGTGRLAWRAGWYIRPLAELNKSPLHIEFDRLKRRLYCCFVGPTKNEIVEQIERLIVISDQIMTKTPWQIKNDIFDYFKELQNINKSNILLEMLGVSPDSTFHLYHKTKAQANALITVLAILRFKADTGQFPESLKNLISAGYLQAVPNDPYSSNSLVYKLTEDGFKLYSVGENFKDDDGTIKLDIIYWPVQQQKRRQNLYVPATPFRENSIPEEIEKQAELMKDIIKEKKKLERIGL